MFKSFTHNMNSPTNTPKNKDNIVSFVMNAKPIATRGGSSVNMPNLMALFSLAGMEEIHNDNANRAIIETAAIIPIFIFLSIITPFFLNFLIIHEFICILFLTTFKKKFILLNTIISTENC